MVRAAGPGIGIIGTSMIEDDMRAILAHPQSLICSDGQLAGKHPRGYGAFPRVLGRYVREQKVISIEEAVAKMTGRSATQIGLADRGVVPAGRKADLVVFDAATIGDRGTPANPSARSGRRRDRHRQRAGGHGAGDDDRRAAGSGAEETRNAERGTRN